MATGRKRLALVFALLGTTLGPGCSLNHLKTQCGEHCYVPSKEPTPCAPAMAVEEPCLDEKCLTPWREQSSPLDLTEESISEENTLNLSLEDAIAMALRNSSVLRDLGGAVLSSPEAVGAFIDPALAFTDPRFGQEAALAEFDATLDGSLRFENNDRAFNNQFIGNAGLLQQDFHNYNWGITKRSATGAQFGFRHVTLYDSNNQLSNRFADNTSWETYLEGEIRQPLLQGAGTQFNRIAGPNAQPGNINGVLIARVRQDLSIADFQRDVRDLVADIENAYWDLYFAYRDLEAKIEVRDKAFEVWDTEKAKGGAGQVSDAAQAREQYFRFQAEVVDSLNGRPVESTRTNNGSTGGTFRGQGGLRFAERRLRLIVGLPINDGQIIRPADTPADSLITFDWNGAISEALSARVELRKQRWVIKQRELELTANRNFLKPRLDLVGIYRTRGFAEQLVDSDASRSAFGQLGRGNLNEFAGGVELSLPVGFRRAHAAVRNSQQSLARERAVLAEQERYVHFGLSNAFNELRRSFDNRQLQGERLAATVEQIGQLTNREGSPLDVLLEAQRRLLDIRLAYHRAEIDYALAIRNIHVEKGTLLSYCNVFLNEAIAPSKAYRDVNERRRLRGPAHSPGHRDPAVASNTK